MNKAGAVFQKSEAAGILDPGAILKVISDVFGQKPDKVIEGEEFTSLYANLKDTITAIKYVQVSFHSLR